MLDLIGLAILLISGQQHCHGRCRGYHYAHLPSWVGVHISFDEVNVGGRCPCLGD